MAIPYRTRKMIQRVCLIVLAVLLALALVFGCWLLWLHKFIRYTADGAVLDFDMPPMSQDGQLAVPPVQQETIPIYYNEGDNAINTDKELTQLVGYYITAEDLQNIEEVKAQVRNLPNGTPVMVDVKSIYGSFYYSSSVSDLRNSAIDTAAMDQLLQQLKQSGAYTIARLPALRDKAYGLEHDEDGVFHSSRGYLWMDDEGCYWLNPSREGTISHIVAIVNELKNLGFNEVVFYDFRFPETSNIYVEGDQSKAIATAAQNLVTACATDYFAVSFVGKADFPLPEGRSRLYVESSVAAEAAGLAERTGLEDPLTRLVFLTENHDTRFDAYSVLRPISGAH